MVVMRCRAPGLLAVFGGKRYGSLTGEAGMIKVAIGVMLLVVSGMACAEDLRDLGADRPGKGSPACTVDAGHLQAELGLADWTHDHNAGGVEHHVLLGDLALR